MRKDHEDYFESVQRGSIQRQLVKAKQQQLEDSKDRSIGELEGKNEFLSSKLTKLEGQIMLQSQNLTFSKCSRDRWKELYHQTFGDLTSLRHELASSKTDPGKVNEANKALSTRVEDLGRMNQTIAKLAEERASSIVKLEMLSVALKEEASVKIRQQSELIAEQTERKIKGLEEEVEEWRNDYKSLEDTLGKERATLKDEVAMRCGEETKNQQLEMDTAVLRQQVTDLEALIEQKTNSLNNSHTKIGELEDQLGAAQSEASTKQLHSEREAAKNIKAFELMESKSLARLAHTLSNVVPDAQHSSLTWVEIARIVVAIDNLELKLPQKWFSGWSLIFRKGAPRWKIHRNILQEPAYALTSFSYSSPSFQMIILVW